MYQHIVNGSNLVQCSILLLTFGQSGHSSLPTALLHVIWHCARPECLHAAVGSSGANVRCIKKSHAASNAANQPKLYSCLHLALQDHPSHQATAPAPLSRLQHHPSHQATAPVPLSRLQHHQSHQATAPAPLSCLQHHPSHQVTTPAPLSCLQHLLSHSHRRTISRWTRSQLGQDLTHEVKECFERCI